MKPAFAPARPFTDAQLRVAELLVDSRGLTYTAIGRELGLERQTVASYVRDMADLLPGRLPGRVRVTLWGLGYRAREIEKVPYPTGPRGRSA